MYDNIFLDWLMPSSVTEQPYIKSIKACGPAVMIFWSDGTKTVSKYNIADEYAPYNVLIGVLLGIVKKHYKGSHLRYILKAIDDSEFSNLAELGFDKWLGCGMDEWPSEVNLNFENEDWELVTK